MKQILPQQFFLSVSLPRRWPKRNFGLWMNVCYAVENSPSVKKQVYTSDTYKAERNAAVASFPGGIG